MNSGWRRFAGVWVAAFVLGAGLDLATARLSGYAVRVDRAMLLTAHMLAWALYAAAALGIMLGVARLARGARPLERAPRSLGLAVVVAPLCARAAAGSLTGWGWILLALAGVALVPAVRRERGSRADGPGARTWGPALAAGLLLGAAAAWPVLPGRSQLGGDDRDSGAASAEAPNVLLIVLDTVRADHLGLYGYDRATSPFLDAFARGATVFDRAIAPSSWTLPSHASLFTGLFPREHGADTAIDAVGIALEHLDRGSLGEAPVAALSEEAETLAERVAELGLHTGAICANTSYLYRAFGLAQGFETYVDAQPIRRAARPAGFLLAASPLQWEVQELRRALIANEVTYLRADEVTDLALTYLRSRHEQRFFLFLNYMDAHFPFCPTGRYARLFPESDTVWRIAAETIRSRARAPRRREAASLRGRYDAELRLVDDQLRRLFAQLEAWRLLDRTLVLIVGDHGEALGEHGDVYHNNGAYETVVHVPLLLRRPGQTSAARIARTTSILDVYPTVLEELGLPVPRGQHGVHLLSDAPRGPVVTYTAPWPPLALEQPRYYARHHWAIYRWPYKLIERSDGSRELYDLSADAEELHDLSAGLPARVRELSDSLAVHRAGLAPRFARTDAQTDPETLERVRGLGYIR